MSNQGGGDIEKRSKPMRQIITVEGKIVNIVAPPAKPERRIWKASIYMAHIFFKQPYPPFELGKFALLILFV